MITYQKYSELVPQETLEFTNSVLLNLDSHIKEPFAVKTNGTYIVVHEKNAFRFLIVMHCLNDIPRYQSLLKILGYNELQEKFNIINEASTTKEKLEDLFAKYSDIFCFFRDDSSYISLSPAEIVLEISKKYFKETYTPHFDAVFGAKTKKNTVINKIEGFDNDEKERNNERIRSELYRGLSANVINYINEASKIKEYLLDNEGKNKRGEIAIPFCDKNTNIRKYASSIAFLIALNNLQEIKHDNYKTSRISVILKLLSDKNILFSNQDISGYYLSNYCPNMVDIDYSFRSYFEKGRYEGKEHEEVTIEGIVENILVSNFEGFVLRDLVVPLEHRASLDHFASDVELEYQHQIEVEGEGYLNKLCDTMSINTKAYLELATKYYQIIDKKMKNLTHNSAVLNSSVDLDTLSLLIASFHYKLDIAEFFESYGVSLEDILKFLKIDVTDEELEKENVDYALLYKVFKKFVLLGVNSKYNNNNISPNDISQNLYNREFNESSIIERIFKELVGESISNDFSSQLEERLSAYRKSQYDKRLSEITSNMDEQSINFLKRLSRVHNIFIEHKCFMKDIRHTALICSLYGYKGNDAVKRALIDDGLDFDRFFRLVYPARDIAANKFTQDLDDDKLDSQILINNYMRLMVDMNNTPRSFFNMLKQIPSYCEIECRRDTYETMGVNFSLFNRLEEKTEKSQLLIEEEKREELIEKMVSGNPASDILKEAMKLFECLKASDSSLSDDYYRDLSILFSLLKSEKESVFFKKNGLTLEIVCSLLNIKPSILKTFKTTDVRLANYLSIFKKYIENTSSDSEYKMEEFKARFFENNSAIGKVIELYNNRFPTRKINQDVLRTEVVNNTDYIETLSYEERIKLLQEQKPETLSINDMSSIPKYGNSLSSHAKCIRNAIETMIVDDSSDKYERIAKKIKIACNFKAASGNILSRAIAKHKMRKEGYDNIQLITRVSSKDGTVTLNVEAYNGLIDELDKLIKLLGGELVGYYQIKSYFELFGLQNELYLKGAQEQAEFLGISVGKKTVEESRTGLENISFKDFMAHQNLQLMIHQLNVKLQEFKNSDMLSKQELIKINSAIANHLVVKGSLEFIRSKLLTMLGSQIAYMNGQVTENKALQVSQDVANLFGSLIMENQEKTRQELKIIAVSKAPQQEVMRLEKAMNR